MCKDSAFVSALATVKSKCFSLLTGKLLIPIKCLAWKTAYVDSNFDLC